MVLPSHIRALQFNLEDPFGYRSEEIDADRLLQVAEKAHANTLIVFARDAWGRVFYAGSKLYPRHPRSSLDLGELAVKARERGISLIVMAAHTANRFLYRLHPGWAQRNLDGEVIVLEHVPLEEPVRDPHWPLICPNSPAMDEYFVREVEEALEKTGADALLLDSWRYLPDLSKACYCRYCQERFRREEGLELPRRADPEDEAYRRAWEWRYRVNEESLRKLAQAARGSREGVRVFYNNHPGGWAGRANRVVQRARDALDGVFAEGTEADTKGPGFLTLITKISRALVGEGGMVLTTRNLFHFLRTPQSPPGPTIRQGLREIVAAGGMPVATMFSSQLFTDPRALDALSQVYGELEELEDLLAGAEPLKHIGVVYSTLTQDWGMHPRPEYHAGELEGLAYMIMHSHLPWQVVDDRSLEDPRALRGYRVIIAPAVTVLSTRAEEALAMFLEGGGVLVATHQFGYMREDFTYRHALPLQERLGIWFEGVLKLGYFYLELRENGEQELWRGMARLIPFGDHSTAFKRDRRDPMLGELVQVKASQEAKVHAQVRLSWRKWGYEYALGRSTPPPGYSSGLPGILSTNIGRGAFIYYPFRLGLHYNRLGHPDYLALLTRLLITKNVQAPVEVEAPSTVQAEYYRSGEALLIHLVNHTSNPKFYDAPIGAARQPLPPFDPTYSTHPIREVIPVSNVVIHVHEDLGKALVRVHPRGAEASLGEDGSFNLDELGEYALLEIVPRK